MPRALHREKSNIARGRDDDNSRKGVPRRVVGETLEDKKIFSLGQGRRKYKLCLQDVVVKHSGWGAYEDSACAIGGDVCTAGMIIVNSVVTC